ncbi:MAG: DNA methyltransferase, partial [Bacteroidota bacterium]
KAKFILATDGKDFQAEDLNSGETVVCDYPSFHDHFGFFLSLAGISTVKQIRENAFDIKATSRLNKLYIELLRHNPDWATAEKRHDMNHFLARLIFCFFAEDTDIFHGDGLFTSTIQQMSASNASDTHEIISEIFRAMDIKAEDRKPGENVKNWANTFPYVNGDLFSGSTETPRFTKIARSYLLHVGGLDWKKINPDIFGSMIQAVADEDERGALGMHYTSVPNILKVLNPLFLDELRTELEKVGNSANKLLNLRERIARIRVFDPACGSGNFLVIAYKELRKIEYEINERLSEADRLTEIPLTNFRGIELRDFSAEIARLALIIAEYQSNVLYLGPKQARAEFLPLNEENWITQGNALTIDWLEICPPTSTEVRLYEYDLFSTLKNQAEIDFKNEGGETYICGNPQFKGARKQSKSQKRDLATLFDSHNDYKDCDYVTGWFLKAASFLRHCDGRFAFVSTSSICQGEQVAHLWSRLYSQKLHIVFAHQGFKWKNNAANNAVVHCVIVGVSKSEPSQCLLYSDDHKRIVSSISPYLVPGPELYVNSRDTPLNIDLNPVVMGSMARDNGRLILKQDEATDLEVTYPEIKPLIKGLLGSQELIHHRNRRCIW